MSEEKSTKHEVIIRLISPIKITPDQAVFKLASSFDKDALDENRLLIIGYGFDDSLWFDARAQKKDREPSRIAGKIKDIASRSPGALGDLFALLKGRSWKELYIGFAGIVLISVLLYKWLIRLITGTF